jgi:hypothetical protein
MFSVSSTSRHQNSGRIRHNENTFAGEPITKPDRVRGTLSVTVVAVEEDVAREGNRTGYR